MFWLNILFKVKSEAYSIYNEINKNISSISSLVKYGKVVISWSENIKLTSINFNQLQNIYHIKSSKIPNDFLRFLLLLVVFFSQLKEISCRICLFILMDFFWNNRTKNTTQKPEIRFLFVFNLFYLLMVKFLL